MEPDLPIGIEARFDAFTFRDLPDAEKDSLIAKLNSCANSATVNPNPRDTELDQQYFKRYNKPRPRGGLHGGLGEQVYLYLLGVGLYVTTKVVDKTLEEIIKKTFEWLDERYKRKGETGLAEVTIYGPDGKQINTKAIVYDGRERKK